MLTILVLGVKILTVYYYKDITNNMNNKIDEVIFEGDYNKYQDLVDKLLKISVVLIDYIDMRRNDF